MLKPDFLAACSNFQLFLDLASMDIQLKFMINIFFTASINYFSPLWLLQPFSQLLQLKISTILASSSCSQCRYYRQTSYHWSGIPSFVFYWPPSQLWLLFFGDSRLRNIFAYTALYSSGRIQFFLIECSTLCLWSHLLNIKQLWRSATSQHSTVTALARGIIYYYADANKPANKIFLVMLIRACNCSLFI